MSLARRHRSLMLAAAAAAIGTLPPEQRPTPGPEATEYELLRAQLGEDLRRLKDIQSIEKKIELKRELAPKYFPWVEGALRAAEESGKAGPDDIVTQVMIWSIDVGSYASALHLARHMIRYALPMPDRFDRGVEAFVLESVADSALKAIGCGETFDRELLLEAEEATDHADMHDEIRAKLAKAIGLLLAQQAEDEPAEGETRAWRTGCRWLAFPSANDPRPTSEVRSWRGPMRGQGGHTSGSASTHLLSAARRAARRPPLRQKPRTER